MGIVSARAVDKLGRIVVPKELRKALAVKEGDLLNIQLEGRRIYLSPATETCGLCGGRENLVVFGKDQRLCRSCLAEADRVLEKRSRKGVQADGN